MAGDEDERDDDESADERRDPLARLLEEARADPELFHDLVFDPEAVIGRLDYLDRRTKGRIVGLDPEEFLARLETGRSSVGVRGDRDCTYSCGGGSCAKTCGERSCGETCGYSCGLTCSHSCGETVGFGLQPLRIDERRSRREGFDGAPFGARRRL